MVLIYRESLFTEIEDLFSQKVSSKIFDGVVKMPLRFYFITFIIVVT